MPERKSKPKPLPLSTLDNKIDVRRNLTVNQETGTVYIEKSVTKNMGEYNFTRITVGVALPINADEQLITDAELTISKVNGIIDNELDRQIDEILGEA